MGDNIKTAIVIGCHRSGTSMIAHILKELGVYMGDDFLGGRNPFNPRGHFENRDFVEVNVDALALADGRWSDPPTREKMLEMRDRFELRIKKVIEENERELWGWKDPRTTLTLELYLPYVENPYLFICYRNTDDIATSLQKRTRMVTQEDIAKEVFADLTDTYNHRIAEISADYPDIPKFNIHYDEAVENPEKTVRLITQFLDIEPTQEQYENAMQIIMSPEEKAKAKKELWKRALRHQT